MINKATAYLQIVREEFRSPREPAPGPSGSNPDTPPSSE